MQTRYSIQIILHYHTLFFIPWLAWLSGHYMDSQLGCLPQACG